MPACGFCSHSCPVRCTFSFLFSILYTLYIFYILSLAVLSTECYFFKETLHGVYWILPKTPTKFLQVNPCIQKYLSRSRYSKIQCPTEVNTFPCILPTQLYQFPALTTVEGSSSSLVAAGFARALARRWYPPQTTNPPVSADTAQHGFVVLKPGVGRVERQGRWNRALPAHGCGVWGCRLEREKRGLLRTWPSCRGTCSAGAGSSKWCGLVPRPDPPRTWLRTSHHPPSYSPRWNRQVLQGERGAEAVSEEPHPAERGRQLRGRGRGRSRRGRAAGKGRGWAAAASAPCPVFTAAAAVNNACPGRGRRAAAASWRWGQRGARAPRPAGMGWAGPRPGAPPPLPPVPAPLPPGAPPRPVSPASQPPRLPWEAASIPRTAAGLQVRSAPRRCPPERSASRAAEPKALLREQRSIRASARPDRHGRSELPSPAPGTAPGELQRGEQGRLSLKLRLRLNW